jgi:four helix bundle protein
MKTHKDLEVWRRSLNFVTEIYLVTQSFPKSELYGLSSQLRRAAVSIPSNISEGAARKSPTEFKRFLYISLGSLSEVETQLLISKNLNYLSDENFESLIIEQGNIARLTQGLIRSIIDQRLDI